MFMFLLLYRVCKHVILGILQTSLCVYVGFVVEGMYTCKTGHFGNKPLCLCLCFCIGRVHMYDWAFWKQEFVFMFVLFYIVCTHV